MRITKLLRLIPSHMLPPEFPLQGGFSSTVSAAEPLAAASHLGEKRTCSYPIAPQSTI